MIARLSLSEVRGVLANRQYTRFTVGNFLSQTGEWSQRLAVAWLAWEFTKSPLWLGLMPFADLAPTLLISPIGGAVVDRVDRIKLTRLTVWLSLGQPLVLIALYLMGLLNVWILFFATFYLGVVHAFNQTARLAVVPLLVPESDIHRVMPINSISFNMARFAGPALFGLIVLVAPAPWALAVNATTYVIFGAILMGVSPREEIVNRKTDAHLLTDTLDGIRYALTHPGIGPLLIVLIASSFGTRPFLDLLPGFADAVFGRGPEALSLMTSVVALGAIAGSAYLLFRDSIVGLAPLSMAWSMLIGVGLIAFTLTGTFHLALALLFFVGIGLSVSAIGVMTILQATVKGEMRGRALATYGIIFRGGPALGGLTMGWIAESTGLAWPVAGGGAMCVLVWMWVLGKLPAVRAVVEPTS